MKNTEECKTTKYFEKQCDFHQSIQLEASWFSKLSKIAWALISQNYCDKYHCWIFLFLPIKFILSYYKRINIPEKGKDEKAIKSRCGSQCMSMKLKKKNHKPREKQIGKKICRLSTLRQFFFAFIQNNIKNQRHLL